MLVPQAALLSCSALVTACTNLPMVVYLDADRSLMSSSANAAPVGCGTWFDRLCFGHSRRS